MENKVSEEKRWGLTYEQADAAKPLGRIHKLHGVPAASIQVEDGDVMNEKPGKVYHEDVVNTLKVQIAGLQGYNEGLQTALRMRSQELADERSRKFAEPGWFMPRRMVNDLVTNSLNDLIRRAKRCSVCDVDLRENGQNVRFEADWIKYMLPVEPVSTQAWVVKLGAAAAKFHEPSVINKVDVVMHDQIIKRLMAQVGYPQSHSLYEAFKQLLNEVLYGHVSLESLVQKASNSEAHGFIDGAVLQKLHDHDNASAVASIHGVTRRDIPKIVAALEANGYKDFAVSMSDEEHSVTSLEEADTKYTDTTNGKTRVSVVDVRADYRHPYVIPQLKDPKIVDAAPITTGEEMESFPPTGTVFLESATDTLDDLSKLQRAVVIGLYGTEAQQEEARQFLKTFFKENYGMAKLMGINTEWAAAAGIKEEEVIR